MPTCYVYCDESHTSEHRFRVQGGIWVPERGMRAIRATFRELRAKHPAVDEIKWNKVRGKKPGPIYNDVVEMFFNSPVAPLLTFNCLVVAEDDDISAGTGAVGRDVGFYKAYYILLKHRLQSGTNHHVRIDEKGGPRLAPVEELRDCLRSVSLRERLGFSVESCLPDRSIDEDIMQLADLLSGAVGWAWNGMGTTCGAKPLLHNHICRYLPVNSLSGYATAKVAPKFNVWRFRPHKKK